MEFVKRSAEEYRAMGAEELEARRAEIAQAFDDPEIPLEDVKAEAEACAAEFSRRNEQAAVRSLKMAEVAGGAGKVLDRSGRKPEAAGDMYDTEEYRRAFMEYVCRGTALPEGCMKRADATTTTSDATAVIPTTLVRDIVRKLDTYGDIWARVRKTNLQGGVEYPVLDLKPTASWITEDAASDDQEIQAKTKVQFSYYGLECKIAQSLLASVVTIEEFQRLFPKLATEAIVKALEAAIVNGTGSGQPTGITVDTRVPAGNKITMAPSEFSSWSAWHKKVKAKMKKAYRNGSFIMAQGTFDGYIDGMVDADGQPVGRVNYGIDGEEAYRFMGKEVLTVEDDVVADYDTAETGDIVGVFVNLGDYVFNSNLQMTSVRWVDHDDNKVKNKVILIADGKLLDANGVLIITKGEDDSGPTA